MSLGTPSRTGSHAFISAFLGDHLQNYPKYHYEDNDNSVIICNFVSRFYNNTINHGSKCKTLHIEL